MGSKKRKSTEETAGDTPLQKRALQLPTNWRGRVYEVSLPEGCTPQRSAAGQEDKKPAKEFLFTLDTFHSEAIKCLDGGESVMVSAHSSAGNTVLQHRMLLPCLYGVAYASPIKALSNQKFRDFKEELSDVGFMTTIDPNASC